MIELVSDSRCIRCDLCVKACPTNVFDAVPDAPPVIARQEDCQTCFMCELYCPADALYVTPDCDRKVAVDEAQIVASGWLGQYRRDSGWGEFRGDPAHANESWRMDEVFARARVPQGS
jgi:NAD-dependent dihydropyrimidine dehydrogenase PreA subunit